MTGLTELVFGLMIIGTLTGVIVTSALLLARKERQAHTQSKSVRIPGQGSLHDIVGSRMG